MRERLALVTGPYCRIYSDGLHRIAFCPTINGQWSPHYACECGRNVNGSQSPTSGKAADKVSA